MRAVPRRWSRNPFSKTGPVARLFGMERQARKLAAEGARLKGMGNLQSAFTKFQFAASSEKNPRFSADLHEMAADTMFEIVGRTRDDAAGEAFDKISKLLGLSYPGGPIIDKIARNGDPKFHQFPRALNKKDNYERK